MTPAEKREAQKARLKNKRRIDTVGNTDVVAKVVDPGTRNWCLVLKDWTVIRIRWDPIRLLGQRLDTGGLVSAEELLALPETTAAEVVKGRDRYERNKAGRP